jgi:hypothetical protein
MGLIKRIKNSNKSLFGQIVDLVPDHILLKVVKQFKSDHYCKTYKTKDQLIAMLFGQLNKCNTLRDITAGLNVHEQFLRELGLKQSPARSTMSDGNEKRDWKVFEALFKETLDYYGRLFRKTEGYKHIEELKNKKISLIDSTTISLCLSLFNWAHFRTAKGAIKIHTKLDEGSEIPEMVFISEGKMHDRKGLDHLTIEQGSIVVDDRGYYDYALFASLIKKDVIFVTRIKGNADYKIIEEIELPEDKDHHILIAQKIKMQSTKAMESGLYAYELRRLAVFDEVSKQTIEIITNDMSLTLSTIAELYKRRWKVEIFFKNLKQNLNVKTFLGTSENACKAQIYIALLAYILMEFVRRFISKARHALKQFINLIRICLMQYQGLNYVVSEIKPISLKVRGPKEVHSGQISIW